MDEELASLFEGDVTDWVEALPAYQRELIMQMLAHRDPLEVALAWLNSTGPTNTEPFGAFRTASNAFYDSLLSQLFALLCGKTEFIDERRELIRNAKAGRTALVAATAGIIAPHLGISVVLVAPAIALTFAMMTQASKDSACATLKQLIDDRQSNDKQ